MDRLCNNMESKIVTAIYPHFGGTYSLFRQSRRLICFVFLAFTSIKWSKGKFVDIMKLTHATPRGNCTWLLFGTAGFRNIHWLGRGWGTSKHNCLVSYLLCWRRHISATVGHLQVTNTYIEENYTQYNHSIGTYSKHSTRSRRRLDYPYWVKSTSSK